MTEVFRDGEWQSVAEKSHPQEITGGQGGWVILRWIGSDRKGHGKLDVLRDGVQLVGFAVRVRPPAGRATFGPDVHLWWRIQRYPIEAGDNGTYWNGPVIAPAGEPALYFAPGLFADHKGGKVGRSYGVDIRSSKGVKVDQFKMTLKPADPA